MKYNGYLFNGTVKQHLTAIAAQKLGIDFEVGEKYGSDTNYLIGLPKVRFEIRKTFLKCSFDGVDGCVCFEKNNDLKKSVDHFEALILTIKNAKP
jgi:hypothetical protein